MNEKRVLVATQKVKRFVSLFNIKNQFFINRLLDK